MINAGPITNLSSLSIRRATEADRAALEHIAGRTWAGQDYLPVVITEWLADTRGEFAVAVDRGVHGSEPDTELVVGTGKLTWLAEGEWWLEGLRVDPDLYGHGIGQAIHQYLIRRAESLSDVADSPAQQGGGNAVIRFVTGSKIIPVQRMALHSGFSLVSQFISYDANTKGDAAVSKRMAEQFRQLTREDLPLIQAFLASSRHFEQVQRSVFRGNWHAELITPVRLTTWLANQMVYSWHGQRKDSALVDGLVILELPSKADDDNVVEINYLDAVPGQLAVMAQAVRCLGQALGHSTLHHMLLYRPERLVAIEQAGWRRPDDDSGRADLFSRPLGITLNQEVDP